MIVSVIYPYYLIVSVIYPYYLICLDISKKGLERWRGETKNATHLLPAHLLPTRTHLLPTRTHQHYPHFPHLPGDMVKIEEVTAAPAAAPSTAEAEAVKAAANDLFKKKEFKKAAAKYGDALAKCNALPSQVSPPPPPL
jgi:hypothetical protein